MDTLSKEKRSEIMSKIRSSGTKPELLMHAILHRLGVKHATKSNLPGRPDFVLAKGKVAVFVDGCFWHKCPLHFKMPSSNVHFWADKIRKNVARDRCSDTALAEQGISVMRLWECCVKELGKGLAGRRKK